MLTYISWKIWKNLHSMANISNIQPLNTRCEKTIGTQYWLDFCMKVSFYFRPKLSQQLLIKFIVWNMELQHKKI